MQLTVAVCGIFYWVTENNLDGFSVDMYVSIELVVLPSNLQCHSLQSPIPVKCKVGSQYLTRNKLSRLPTHRIHHAEVGYCGAKIFPSTAAAIFS